MYIYIYIYLYNFIHILCSKELTLMFLWEVRLSGNKVSVK